MRARPPTRPKAKPSRCQDGYHPAPLRERIHEKKRYHLHEAWHGVARCATWHAIACSERTHAVGGPVVEEADSLLRVYLDDTTIVEDGSTALHSNAGKRQRLIAVSSLCHGGGSEHRTSLTLFVRSCDIYRSQRFHDPYNHNYNTTNTQRGTKVRWIKTKNHEVIQFPRI